jgi:hypothetical protein
MTYDTGSGVKFTPCELSVDYSRVVQTIVHNVIAS